jgi:hypothetical protein
MSTTAAVETTATESPVTIAPVAGYADLHQHYRGQTSPQPCHVSLACDTGTLTADFDGIIGSGVPSHVYHGRTLRWSIPCLTADAANALLDEVIPIAKRIVAGYSCEWDGNNHVGAYDDDAEAAREEMASLLDGREFSEGEKIEVWDACDWYGAIGGHDAQRRQIGITAATTDEELDAIETREDAAAEARIIEGLRAHLDMLRDEAREESDDAE